jgi:hypothetical protein
MSGAAAEIERLTAENIRLKVETERLQEAKRRALAIADERSRENAALRAEVERLRAEGRE